MSKSSLWISYKENNDASAKEQLIVQYVELVKIIAGRLFNTYNQNVDYDDLVGYGIMGLIDAIEKFDLSKNVKFETYANIRIRGAIVDQLRAMDWIPRSTRQKFKKLEDAMNKLQNIHGDNINDSELAYEMGITTHELSKLMLEVSNVAVISLDEKISENANFGIKSGDVETNPEGNLSEKETKRALLKNIESLPEKERMVINLYYYSELTYKEISEVMKISESRISQLHSKAIAKIRNSFDRY